MKTLKPKKLMLTIAIATVAFLLSGATFAWGASIKGNVTYDNGIGISGVRVSCSGGSDYTSSSGAYEISGLDDGTYYVNASKSGFSFSPSSQRVTISYGWDERGVDFTAPTHYVDGYVKYDTGQAISGVNVNCSYPGGSDSTNSSGYYKIDDLINDSYSVSVTVDSVVKSDMFWIDGGNERVNFTFTTYSISGYVTYDIGGGVSGVTVSCGGGSDTTGANGSYTIDGLHANTWYYVSATKSGCEITPSSRSVHIFTSNEGGVNFTVIVPKYSASGYVKDGGPAGIGVEGVSVSFSSQGSATTDANGHYTKTNLPNGMYTVTASKTGYYGFSPSANHGGSVTINGADEPESIDFYTYDISGYVRHGNGDGIEGATVTIEGYDPPLTTDINGYYEKEHLASGDYNVTVSFADYSFSPISPYNVSVTNNSRNDIHFYTYNIDGYVKRYGTNVGENRIDVRITGGDRDIDITVQTHDRDGDPLDPGYYKLEHIGGGTYTIEATNP